MALEMNDLMALKSLGNGGMSPYEQFKVGAIQSHRASGTAIGALAVGIGAAVAGVGAWIFAPMYGSAKAAQARESAIAAKEQATLLAAGTQRQLDQLTALYAAERSERINGDQTITQTITDTVSGSQQGSLTAQQQSELSAVNSVMQQTFADAITGRSSLNATPVQIYSAPQPCGCPGCGCNG